MREEQGLGCQTQSRAVHRLLVLDIAPAYYCSSSRDDKPDNISVSPGTWLLRCCSIHSLVLLSLAITTCACGRGLVITLKIDPIKTVVVSIYRRPLQTVPSILP